MRKLATVIVFQCKQCGGELSVKEGDTLATCEYCGSTQTLPSSQDEHLKGLFVRANGFRLKNAFDKATGLYEDILKEDSTQAEAYWGLLLCEYGIEYVVDPETERRVPTCHRLSYTPISESENYAEAMRYADGRTKVVYQQNAETLEALRKAVAAKAKQVQPVDVFICYKESEEGDLSRRRTLDSELAGSLYDDLTEAGFKVFFARESLKEYSGEEYEPYIFAALHSAKVMLVVATSRAHIDATWVKNEWSRYLTLMAGDSKTKRRFVPCIKNMGPEDLPDRFIRYECANLGEPGAQDDLVRSLKKFLRAQPEQQAMPQTMAAATATVGSLMKRAENELRFGNWKKASELYDQVINVQPELPEAYLGLVMAEMQSNSRERFESLLKDTKNTGIRLTAEAAGNKELHEQIKRAVASENITLQEGQELKQLLKTLEQEERAGAMIDRRARNCIVSSNFKSLCYYAKDDLKAWIDGILEERKHVEDAEWAKTKACFEERRLRVAEIQNLLDERARAWKARVQERDTMFATEFAMMKQWQERHNIAMLAPRCLFAGKSHFVSVADGSLTDVSLLAETPQTTTENCLQAVYMGERLVKLDVDGTTRCGRSLPFLDGIIGRLAVGGTKLYAVDVENRSVASLSEGAKQWSRLPPPPQKRPSYLSQLYAGQYGAIVKDIQDVGYAYIVGDNTVHVKHDIRMGAVGANFYAWLDDDGRVSVEGKAPDISAWEGECIAAISAGDRHLLALTADGRVLAVGDNNSKQCEVSKWENCVAVIAGPHYSVAIQEDGTLLSTHPRVRQAFASKRISLKKLGPRQENKVRSTIANLRSRIAGWKNQIDLLARKAKLSNEEFYALVTSRIGD